MILLQPPLLWKGWDGRPLCLLRTVKYRWKDACENWQSICGPFCKDDTNERGLRLLEFATFNDLVLANTSQDGPGIAQMDKVDIKKSTTTSRGA